MRGQVPVRQRVRGVEEVVSMPVLDEDLGQVFRGVRPQSPNVSCLNDSGKQLFHDSFTHQHVVVPGDIDHPDLLCGDYILEDIRDGLIGLDHVLQKTDL